MKRLKKLIVLLLILTYSYPIEVYAEVGNEMGVFGGISEGKNLPYTMDSFVDSGVDEETTFIYKEYQFLSGEPILFTGTIEVEIDDVDFTENPTGTYEETYDIEATNGDDSIERSITFITAYRVVENEFNKQIIRNSIVDSWSESLTVGGEDYTLDEDASTFSKSSVEHLTPGVSYYDTVLSYNAEYTLSDESTLTVDVYGNIYGYDQPWSKVETQSITQEIDSDDLQMTVKLKPFLESNKSIYFDETIPYTMSFGGTYNQRLERESNISYEILSTTSDVDDDDEAGQARITNANVIEKLPIPEDLDFLIGHWAEEDFKKLYSMEILTEEAREGMQYEAMTRGEFVKALCLALDMDLSVYEEIDEDSPQVFDDVAPEHNLYKYIMTAYDNKLIKGVGDNFNVDLPVTRQEAFVIYIRIIGLERLGVTDEPVTPFIDDGDIASWAKQEIMAGYNLGIIKGTDEGAVLPNQWINKAESAAIINRLIDYLREEIARDYK